MRIVFFCHSLLSDWNHGNAHFLRGVTAELLARGHQVDVYEPADGWSRANLLAERGEQAIAAARAALGGLSSSTYDPARVGDQLGAMTEGADLVIVHEWNEPDLVAAIGHLRPGAGFRLLFHDTHHRSVTQPEQMARYDLDYYDGVLAFGAVIRQIYLDRGWAQRAWTWHEAADTRLFHPVEGVARQGDLVWVGNWGDGERAHELHEFLLGPAQHLGLSGRVHGVRYPPQAVEALTRAGLEYAGWAPNHEVPRIFAAYGATVHVPRRPYVESLPGIPTIRPFEALACGIPLVSAPWDDAEGLFMAGEDYLVAKDEREMTGQLHAVLTDEDMARSLSEHGRRTVLARHTCAHRVDELLAIAKELGIDG